MTLATSTLRRSTDGPHRARRLELDGGIIVGILALITMLALAVYGPMVAPHDPFFSRLLFEGKIPPYDPSPTYPLGSDAAGRDRLTFLLYGARTTFAIAFAAAAIRLVVGSGLGVLAGWRGGAVDLMLGRVALALASLPASLAVLLLLLTLGPGNGFVPFVIALSVLGWADAFRLSRRYARTELSRPYVESARALGLTGTRLLWRHLVPNIAPGLLTVAALQVSAVLLLLGELALLRLFFGGSVSVDFFGRATLLPSEPEWAAMLGTTRPIFDIYGNAVAVLLPAAALLGAVLSINVFVDALAHRAQRLDVFHLVTRRQLAIALAATIVLLAPALLWRGRLAEELTYADAADAAVATRSGEEIRALPQADAAERLAARIGGQVVPFSSTVTGVHDARLAIAGQEVGSSAFRPLTIRDASVSGELVLADLYARLRSDELAGRIVMVNAPGLTSLPLGFFRFSIAGALALILIDGTRIAQSPDYPIPVIDVRKAVLEQVLGREIPRPAFPGGVRYFDVTAEISTRTGPVVVTGTTAVARIAGVPDNGPLFVLAAPLDESDARSNSASVIAAVAELLRRAPLPADVLILALALDGPAHAGLTEALRTLSPDDRRRIAALLVLAGPADEVTVRSDPATPESPSASTQIGRRVADALRARYEPQPRPELLRALASVDARAPTYKIFGDPGPTTRAVLTLLAYIARHPEELQH